MRKATVITTLVAVLFVGLTSAVADTLVLQQGLNGYSGTWDGELRANGATTNFGNLTYLSPWNNGGSYTGSASVTALIRFDLASVLPEGAEVTSATLSLFEYMSRNGYTHSVTIHRVKNEWQNGTGGFSGASWNYSWQDGGSNRILWTAVQDGAAGALGEGNINLTPTDTATWNSGSTSTWPTFNPPSQVDLNVTADILAFLNGDLVNFGWLLKESSTAYDRQPYFYSSEATTSSVGADVTGYRPMLTIEYTIPEPATMCLLVAGGMGIWLRRKR